MRRNEEFVKDDWNKLVIVRDSADVSMILYFVDFWPDKNI